MGLRQTINVLNHTAGTIQIGVEPLGEFCEIAGGDTATFRTTFVEGASELEIVAWDKGISLFLFGPTDLPEGDSLPNLGPGEATVPVDGISLKNETTATLRLRIAGAAVDVEAGGRRDFRVDGADDALLITTGVGELAVQGCAAWPV
jgi:hypothetical protein